MCMQTPYAFRCGPARFPYSAAQIGRIGEHNRQAFCCRGWEIGQPPPSSQTSKHPGAYGGALADFGHNPGTIRLTRGQSFRYNRAGPHADGRAIRSTFGVSAGNGTAFASPRQRQRVHLPDRPPFASDRIMGRSFAAATRFSTEPMDAAPRMGIGFHGRAGE